MSTFRHTRQIPASVEAVFQAIADPVRLARWWGPDGFTNTIQKFEFTPGGNWDFIMHGPDGTNYPNQAMFTEIIPNSSVVIKHVGQPHFLLSISLAPSANGTVVTWVQEFEDPAFASNVRHIVEPANEQNLARWEHEVTTLRELTLTRIFDAPRELVWEAWTNPEQVAKWWGPHGFTNPLCEWNAQPGNAILVHMHGPKGSPFDCDMPMGGVFEAVHAPERLVFITNALPDENGKPRLEVRNCVTFEECGGKTRVTLQAVVLKSTPAVAGAIAGMEQGWSQSLEKLAALLEELA